MRDKITVVVNGNSVAVGEGASAAVAVMMGGAGCRRSVRGELRGPLCGMGICFECRAEVDGIPHLRSCQILCRPGMVIRTDE